MIFCINPLSINCTKKINEIINHNIIVTTFFEPSDNEKVISVLTNTDASGKMAAEMLASYGCKNVAVFSGDMQTFIHKTIVKSFTEKLNELNVSFVNNYETKEDVELSGKLMKTAINNNSEIDGIYISTANSYEICRVIKQYGLSGKIKIIASDLFPDLIPYIESGTVNATIYQNQVKQAKTAFHNLYHYIADNIKPQRVTYTTPLIIIKSNLNLYIGDV